MSRKARNFSETGIYHIIIRGNNQQNIFNDDEDRLILLNRIQKYSSELNIHIYAYCLMNNHVHMLIGNANPNMSKFMLKLNTSYSRLFNMKYERSGHLFQGRYLSKPVKNNAICMKVIRYILQNPQKAGLGRYDEFIWNSFHSIVDDNLSFIYKPILKVHIDKDFIFNLFINKTNFISYLNISTEEVFMEYEGKKYINDNNCIILIKKIMNITNIYQINKIPIDEIIKYLKTIKSFGISQNQISRITGISRKIIRAA